MSRSHTNRTALALVAGMLLLCPGCGDSGAPATDATDGPGTDLPPPSIVDIRADVNRNGQVDLSDPTEDADEEKWDASHGAVFLANIDDDDVSCRRPSSSISDDELAACHDASNDTLDGDADLADLAPLKTVPWPAAPDSASGMVKLALPNNPGQDPRTYVRLFRREGTTITLFKDGDALPAAALRQGVELRLEGRDIVRDASKWDGYLDVTLEVQYSDGGDGGQTKSQSDTLRMRVAPVLTSHHLQPLDTLYVSKSDDPDSIKFRADLKAAAQAASVPKTIEIATWDQWTQDYFETGWMSMPAPGGKQHVITVYIRSANVDNPNNAIRPLREAGRVVYDLRGLDIAAVQQYDIKHPWDMDTLCSLGNLETIPPHSHGNNSYPMGRMMMGKVANFYPDPTFTAMLEGQKVQSPLWMDTSWLLVGHVDETMSFIKASTPRGWLLLLNDPALAKQMLQDASTAGHGATVMFEGQFWDDGQKVYSAQTTIDQVLADTEVMSESAKAVTEVASQLALFKQETGITDAEIVHLPFLHYPVEGYSVAYQPGTVNGTVLADAHYAAPQTHGPVIGGVDIFKKQLTDELGKHGVTVHYIENWNLYHRLLGEVHCGTNALRVVPANPNWWESGR